MSAATWRRSLDVLKRVPWREALVDLVGLAGIGLLVNGVRLVFAPAAWIVGGLALVAWAIAKGRAAP